MSQKTKISGYRRIYGSLGYRSARVATSEGRSYVLYPHYAHGDRDRLKLIGQSRQFLRDNAIYKGLIERMVSYIVGNGFELQAESSSASTVRKTEKLWSDFFAGPEIRGILSGPQVAKMVIRELLVAGDSTVLKTDKGLIQIFEAEQLDGDKSYPNGIKKDRYGRPVRYHLCPWKSHAVDKRNGRSYPASDIMFVTNPERPSAIRGIPASQAAFSMLHRVNDICDSEAIAWQLLSRLAVTVVRQEGPQIAYTESKTDPNKSTDQLEGDLARRVAELDYALMFHGEPGEEIKGIDRNIPGRDFPASVRMFLRLLGLPLGCPLEIILLDWTRSNYSQSRAVLEQAYENFSFYQRLAINSFFRPLFEWKLAGWRNSGLVAKTAKIKAGWITPTFPWIDQLKEAQAQASKIDRGFVSHTAVCKFLKSDRDEVIAAREREVRDAIERAKKIEDDTGEKVDWRIFAGLEASASKSKAQPADDDDADADKEKKEDE